MHAGKKPYQRVIGLDLLTQESNLFHIGAQDEMAQQAQGAQYEIRTQQQLFHQSLAFDEEKEDEEMEAATGFEEACKDDPIAK